MRKTFSPQNRSKEPNDDASRALDSLSRYLARRDHSRFELTQKLKRRFDADLVAALVAKADEWGWLKSEEEVAEGLVRALRSRNKSWFYIEGQLRRRRLPAAQAEEKFESEAESIRSLLTRKFGSEKFSLEQSAKAYRFLKYRGFADRAIRQVLNEKRKG